MRGARGLLAATLAESIAVIGRFRPDCVWKLILGLRWRLVHLFPIAESRGEARSRQQRIPRHYFMS
ncbi:MAG: hypothetical protein ABFC96_13165 [Thermoguttaceae bacterium]